MNCEVCAGLEAHRLRLLDFARDQTKRRAELVRLSAAQRGEHGETNPLARHNEMMEATARASLIERLETLLIPPTLPRFRDAALVLHLFHRAEELEERIANLELIIDKAGGGSAAGVSIPEIVAAIKAEKSSAN